MPTGIVNADQLNTIFLNTLEVMGVIAWFLIGLGIAGFIAFYFLFNINVQIWELVGSSKMPRFVKKARAKIITKDGKSSLWVFGFKDKVKPPEDNEYMLAKNGKLLAMIKEGGTLTPFTITANPGHMVIGDHDKKFWYAQARENIVKKYSEVSWWKQNAPYVMFVMGMFVLGWMFYVQLKFINGNLAETTSTARSLAQAIQGGIKAP